MALPRNRITTHSRLRANGLRLLLCVLLLSAPFFAGCGNPAAPIRLVSQVVFSPVTIAGAAYASGRDQRGVGAQLDDAAIRASIRARFRELSFADNLHISIYSYNGTVFLMGEVSPATRAAATNIARRANGVRHVYTHWFEENSGDIAADLSIAMILRATMIADLHLSSTQIDTYTCGGNVLLLGIVRSAGEARHAETLAQNVAGVRSVTSYLLF